MARGRACAASCLKLLAVLSVCLVLAAFLLPDLIQFGLELGIRGQVIWRPDSPPDVDARYRGTDSLAAAPDIVQVWLFNVTNVDEIRQGHKPRVEEVGPFVYRKFKIKVASWWDRQGRVACKEYDYHVLVPELTKPLLNATIVTLNMPLIGVVESIHAAFGPAYQRLLDLLISIIAGWKDGHVNGLFTSRTAEELMWGYEDLLLQRLSGLLPRGMIKSTRIALMTNMSGPDEALAQPPVLYDTGRYDINRIWSVVSYQGLTEMRCWNNCSERVRGSDGTQFRPGVERDQVLEVWVPPLFRAESFVFEQDITWQEVQFLRFHPDPAGLEPNACHFQTIRGLMNITTPMAVGFNGSAGDATGPPIYVSQPHFCLSDPSLAAGVEGLRCNMSNHQTYIDVEPITGIPMRAHLTSMVSSEITLAARMHLEPQIAKTNNHSIITPIMWTQEDIHATDADLSNFRGMVYTVLWYKGAAGRYLPAGGAGLFVLSLLGLLAVRGGGGAGQEAAEGARGRGQRRGGGAGAQGRGKKDLGPGEDDAGDRDAERGGLLLVSNGGDGADGAWRPAADRTVGGEGPRSHAVDSSTSREGSLGPRSHAVDHTSREGSLAQPLLPGPSS